RPRVVRRHLPAHLPNERCRLAARQTHARDRAARNAGCSSRPESARVCDAGRFLNEIRTRCVIAKADLKIISPFARWRTLRPAKFSRKRFQFFNRSRQLGQRKTYARFDSHQTFLSAGPRRGQFVIALDDLRSLLRRGEKKIPS